MRSNSILVATLVAAASTVAAEADRPRIYFPRHVKRQFNNATITSPDAVPQSTPAERSTTKREPASFPDFLSDLFGSHSSSASSDDGAVTTIVVTGTVIVPPPTDTETPPSSTSQGSASTGSVPDVIVQPTTGSTSTTPSSLPASTPASSDTTSSGILLAPTGVVTTTTPAATSTSTGILDPLSSFLSSIGSEISSAIQTPNTTEVSTTTDAPVSSTPPAESSTTTEDPFSFSITLFPSSSPTETPSPSSSSIGASSGISGSGTGSAPVSTPTPPISTPPVSSTPPASSSPPGSEPPSSSVNTTSIPVSSVPPPITTSSSLPNITSTDPPPTSIPTSLPPGSTNITVTSTSANFTSPPSSDEPASSTLPGASSTVSSSVTTAPFIPTTMIVDPTPTATSTGALAPTTATAIPSGLPKAITPDTGLEPQPDDTTVIQIGLAYGLNYGFVVENGKAAAQIFQLLPEALAYGGGFNVSRIQMRRLVPLNTQSSLGYITTLALMAYPTALIDALRMDIKIPSASLYHHPEQIVFNLTKQINPAIDIILGSYPEDGATVTGEPGAGSTGTGSTGSNGDPFGTGGDTTASSQSSAQRGTTAGIVTGSVAIAAAYGAAMFIIARRYKRKRQSHRRASSLSGTGTSPSEMRQTDSPALMGGALLSRDFTSSYGAVAGGVAGGRDSHGSGRSNMNNSGRTAYISAPVAAENSLGWN